MNGSLADYIKILQSELAFRKLFALYLLPTKDRNFSNLAVDAYFSCEQAVLTAHFFLIVLSTIYFQLHFFML